MFEERRFLDTSRAGRDIADARRVADQLGIPYYVLNYEKRFKSSVIEDFTDSYLRGETPVPCIRCNQTVKFSDLLKTAKEQTLLMLLMISYSHVLLMQWAVINRLLLKHTLMNL